jgi:PAS domain-containing protein
MPTTLPLELTTLMVFWLCLSLWQRNFQVVARRLFIGLTLACAAWCLGDICYESGLLDARDANRISLLGAFATPALWLGLAAYTADVRAFRERPWLVPVLMLPCAAVYPMLFADAWVDWLLRVEADGSAAFGPVLWSVRVYSWALMGLGSALFLVAAIALSGPGQWPRRAGIGLAAVLPLAADIAFLSLAADWRYDLGPVALGAALLMLHGAIFSGGLLDTLPISQLNLVTHLPVPILVADRFGTVIDVNPEARAHIGLGVHRVLWRKIDDVLPEIPGQPEHEVWPLVIRGQESGQLVLLDPPAKAETREAEREAS